MSVNFKRLLRKRPPLLLLLIFCSVTLYTFFYSGRHSIPSDETATQAPFTPPSDYYAEDSDLEEYEDPDLLEKIISNSLDDDNDDSKNLVSEQSPDDLPICDLRKQKFNGRISVVNQINKSHGLDDLNIFPGGHGLPRDCRPKHKVAIVIPYRDRERQLGIFLENIHSLLSKQKLDYTIIVVDQMANQTFNRAKLMNVGFAEGLRRRPFDCFIFQDVDLLPEDDRNLYTCPKTPRHMSVAVNTFNYKLPYDGIFGGVTALTVPQMRAINGFSNHFWGWGGEDDDISTRLRLAELNVSRYPASVARYRMLPKRGEKSTNAINECRWKLYEKTEQLWKSVGLNSLKYEVLSSAALPLYTRITVDLKESETRPEVDRTICSSTNSGSKPAGFSLLCSVVFIAWNR